MSSRSEYPVISHPGTRKRRLRASRACDSCKAKSRCSGTQPCGLCALLGQACEFTAPYTRGIPRKPPASDQTWTFIARRREKRRKKKTPTIEPESPRTEHASDSVQSFTPGLASSRSSELPPIGTAVVRSCSQEQESNPQPFIRDDQGHFLGTSSNISFFYRLRKRLRKRVSQVPEASIFTFGDTALPSVDAAPFIFPVKDVSEDLLNKYFDLASPTYRFLHRGIVIEWLEDSYSPSPAQKPPSRTKIAVLLGVFANDAQYCTGDTDSPPNNDGVRYFQAADAQIQHERGPIKLESVQARLLQCLFLMTCSRVNHCWSLFGVTSRLIIALGLHRKRSKSSRQAIGTADCVDDESRKILFWCAYNLDKYLSAMLGRPSAFHDEDIDQEYPELIENMNTLGETPSRGPGSDPQVMVAPVLHFKLVRIVSRILQGLYGTQTPTEQRRVDLEHQFNNELEEWRQQMPAFLNARQVDPKFLIPTFERQSNMLSLAHAHAIILVNRGWVLSDLPESLLVPGKDMRPDVETCLSAAQSILETINKMAQAGKMRSAYWFTQYQGFCAIVIIYTYVIRTWTQENEFCLEQFRGAERCQAHIASVAHEGSLAHRYFVIMEEFRSEVQSRINAASHQDDQAMLIPLSPYNISPSNPLTDSEFSMVLNGFLDPAIAWTDLNIEDFLQSDEMSFHTSGSSDGLLPFP